MCSVIYFSQFTVKKIGEICVFVVITWWEFAVHDPVFFSVFSQILVTRS